MRTIVGAALALVIATGSAQAEPIEQDVAGLATSIDAPPGDTGRECLESAVATLVAIADFRLGHASDDAVRGALVEGVTDPDWLAMRQAEGEVWAKTHEPASVASEHFARCLASGGVTLKGSPPATACLQALTPVVARPVDDAEMHELARSFATCLAAGPTPMSARVSAANPPCVVLLGGGGTRTDNSDLDNNWFRVDGAISNAVAAELRAKSYQVWPLIIDAPDAQQRFEALWSELSARHCSRTVQISYALRASGVGDHPDAFSFQADVLRFSAPSGGTVAPTSDYTKSYDFAMTSEVLQHLSVSALGRRIADDILDAGVLSGD